MGSQRGRRWRSTAVLVGVALLAAGCRSSGSLPGNLSPASAAATAAPHAAAARDPRALLPAALRRSGVLPMATDPTYPPMEFAGAGGRPQGFDIDLAAAIGSTLGVRVTLASDPFAQLVTDVGDGRYAAAISSIPDTTQAEQHADLVDYFSGGTSLLVRAGNPDAIHGLADLCGRPVAVPAASVQLAVVEAVTCPAHTPVLLDRTAGAAPARAALLAGSSVAEPVDYPTAVAAVAADPGHLAVTPGQYGARPYAIAVSRTSPGLAAAVAAAVDTLIADGTYGRLLARWHVGLGALPGASINSAG